MTPEKYHLLLLHESDNVLLATGNLPQGGTVIIDGAPAVLSFPLALGHKIARRAIAAGEPVVKYGVSIGLASKPIERGAHVHVHNLVSNYTATYTLENAK